MPTGARGGATRLTARLCTGGSDGQCTRPVPEDAPVPLCTLHLLCAAQWIAEQEPAYAAKLFKLAPRGPRFNVGRTQAVYYVRFRDRIKIGTTTDLPGRMEAVIHEELLAIEPGGNAVERHRHLQFVQFRAQREWFTPAPELLEHVRQVRAEHGDPRAAWADWKRADTPVRA